MGGLAALAWRRDPSAERDLEQRRRLQAVWAVEHGAFLLVLLTGQALLLQRGWGLGHARWLGVKLGLVALLVLPLEAMHAYVCHVWVARGLRQTPRPPLSRDLARGIGMQEMIAALKVPLLGAGVALLVWLSVAKPF